MTKLQANKKDQAVFASRMQLRVGYRVGSYFKGCEHCGEIEEMTIGKRTIRVWHSGYNVIRIYTPSRLGYMYWCYECGAKDRECWKPSDNNTAYAAWLQLHCVWRGRQY